MGCLLAPPRRSRTRPIALVAPVAEPRRDPRSDPLVREDGGTHGHERAGLPEDDGRARSAVLNQSREEWLLFAAQEGYIALTEDERIRFNPPAADDRGIARESGSEIHRRTADPKPIYPYAESWSGWRDRILSQSS